MSKMYPDLKHEIGVRLAKKSAEMGWATEGRKKIDKGKQRERGKTQGKRNADSGHLARILELPQTKVAQRINGRKIGFAMAERERTDPVFKESQYQTRVRSGRTTSRMLSHLRPTWPEARFYGLVLGDPITSVGFTAQQSDGRGIYDGAWLSQKIVAELDGGGHHAFKDRHADDARKDALRIRDGNTVVREADENVLFLKALAILTVA